MPSEEPRYLQLAAELQRQITGGQLPSGAKLPSETQLTRQFGVSRIVVKNAILVLKSLGLVEGRKGSGVYVADSRRIVREFPTRHRREVPVQRSGSAVPSGSGRVPVSEHEPTSDTGVAPGSGPASPFARDAALAGHVATWQHDSEQVAADLGIAGRLRIELGEAVMRTRYTFLADGVPTQLSTSWEPLTITRGTRVEWPERCGLTGVVARFDAIGIHIDESVERVIDRPATGEEMARLGLSSRRAHVQTIMRTYLAGGRPVETADIVMPASRYELVYRLPIESAPAAAG